MGERAGLAKKLPFVFFALTFCFYGFLVFFFFSPDQFHKYALAATQVLDSTLPKERLFDFSPLYLSFHILARKFLGQPDLFLRLAQVAAVSLSVPFIYLILRKFFRFPIALIGTLALLLNPTLIVLTQVYEPEALAFLLVVGFLYFALRDEGPSLLLSGVLAGLAFLMRPNLLPVFLFALLYFLVRPTGSRAKRSLSIILFLVPLLLSASFLFARNARLAGRPTLLAMNPGTVFFEGNNPHSWGTTSMYPYLVYDLAKQSPRTPDVQHELYRRLARLSVEKELTVSEVNGFWFARAVHFIQDHPRRYLQGLVFKTLHLLHSYDWHDLYNTYWNQKKLARSPFPTVPWGFVSALALLGLIAQAPRWKAGLLFYALFLCQTATILVFYVSSRQRLMLLPAFIFFSCAFLEFMASRRRRWTLLAVVIPFSIVLLIPSHLMREEDHLWQRARTSHEQLAEAYRSRKALDYREAEKQAALALATAPWLIDSTRPSDLSFEPVGYAETSLSYQRVLSPSDVFDRAFLLLQSGKLAEAEAEWRALQADRRKWKRDYYQPSSPGYYLALTALQGADPATARTSLLAGLKESPGDPSILSLLTALTEDDQYSRFLFRYNDELSARYYMGKAYLLAGKPRLAAEQLAHVAKRLPDYRAGKVYLAVAMGGAGDYGPAVSLYLDAVTNRPDPVLLEKPVLEVFRARAMESPTEPRAHFEYGVVLRQFGHYQDALAAFDRAKDPGIIEWTDRARREIEAVERILRAHR